MKRMTTGMFLRGYAQYVDPRKEKRHFRKCGMEDKSMYEAWILGGDACMTGRAVRNPYPPGKRHDEFERGRNTADPMGVHHGEERMKTDPRLIAIMQSLMGRPFTPLDWETFSGCESDDPWITGWDHSTTEPLVVIADGETLTFYTDKDVMVSLHVKED